MPGARHSKCSKPGKSRCDRYGGRRVDFRSPRPVLVIVCDDTATAPAYFDLLKREVKQHLTLKVVRAPCHGAAPDMVVQRALGEKRALRGSRDRNDRDAVWILLDLEGDTNRQQETEAARVNARNRGLEVALSVPCYEVWTLLHLEDTGSQFTDCLAVMGRVRSLWKQTFDQEFGSKAQADYSKIIRLCSQAAERAESHWNNNDPSRTEVFRIIRQIDGFLRREPVGI